MRKILIVIAVLLATGVTSSATTLFPGMVASHHFTADPIAFPCGGPCDLLWLFPNYQSLTGAPVLTAQLFDEDILLGTYISPVCCIVAFKTAGSLYGIGEIVDLTSILDGTSNGRIDISVTGGTVEGLVGPGELLLLAHATSANTYSTDFRTTDFTGLTISTPEPSSVLLSIAGLGFLLARARIAKHRRSAVRSPRH